MHTYTWEKKKFSLISTQKVQVTHKVKIHFPTFILPYWDLENKSELIETPEKKGLQPGSPSPSPTTIPLEGQTIQFRFYRNSEKISLKEIKILNEQVKGI
jgi:hypothetical protein